MKYLKIFENFEPDTKEIFYKFSYVHRSCEKGMIWNPIKNSCQSKLDFINDRISDGTFATDKPMDKYLMREIVNILFRCERIFKQAYSKSLHSRYEKESNKITELIDLVAREVKYGQLDRAKPAIESWLRFITPKVSDRNKKIWIESTDGRKWSTDLGKFEVYLELLIDLESTETIQEKIDELSSKIYFYGSSTKIREYSEDDINNIVVILNKYKTIKVSIEGWHNGHIGNHFDVRRADAVKNILVSKGIDETRITTVGRGESKIVPANSYEKNEFGDEYNKNMRVDIKIVE